MNSLYKRLVSIGMISFTALLGWIYCIIEFRDKPVYVICVSVALIISVYVLLRSVISIRQRKDKKLKKDINEAVAKLVADFYEAQAQTEQPDNSLEVERICKALYVQLRKVNTTLSNDLITKEIINNATKVNIKYNHADSSKLLAAISDLSESLKLAPEPQVIIKEVPVAAPEPIQAANEPVQSVAPAANEPAQMQVAPEPVAVAKPEPVKEPEPVQSQVSAPADDGGVLSQDALDALLASMNNSPEQETAAEPEPISTPSQEPTASIPADDGGVLSQADLDSLLASMNNAPDPEPVAETTPEPEPTFLNETASTPADDGGVLSQADLDALLASMNNAPEPEPVAEPTSDMPQNVGASSAEAQSFFDEFEAKKEAPAPEPVKPQAAAPADDGGVLSQAELDALLASMTAAPEPVAETTPESVAETTPEPVAETAPEPEPASNVLEFPTPAPAPIDDDPNRQLSPEEIAALFNSMK